MISPPGVIAIVNQKTTGFMELARRARIFALLCLLTLGCFRAERKPPNAKPVTPVSGVVLVDGKPRANVQIKFHPASQDPQNATLSVATTDEEGQFKAWTYRPGDGIPPGDYTVTFDDQSKKKPHERTSPDLFKGKYADPKKSKFKITVPETGNLDMETIELTH